MRIIGGEAKGRRLFAPKGEETRPTADRVRESLFNILRAETPGARVLDLFSGTGALAIEALSRGAREAVMVDSSRLAVEFIQRNLQAAGFESRGRVLPMDWRRALTELTGCRFDLVFLDPPYRMAEVYWAAARSLLAGGLLADGALLVMEYDAARPLPPSAPPFVHADTRRYGAAAVDFYKLAEENGGEAHERMPVSGEL